MSLFQAYNQLKYFLQRSLMLPKRWMPTVIRGKSSTANMTVEKKKYGAVVKRAVLENSSKPLVVILGWNDSKLKYLQKYSQIFEEQDWPTICLPTKSFNTFLRAETKVKTISMYMVDLIKELTEKGNPVFLYSFSNGGCAVYFHMAEALTSPGQKNYNAFKVIGSIFDSCPVKPAMDRIPGVQVSITERMKNPVVRAIIWHLLGLVMPIIVKRSKLMDRYFRDLGTMSLDCPQLFLYSKADHLAFSQDIDEHIGDRQSQGIQVLHKCWDDSPHVGHYVKYPEEYTKLLETFLDVCLNIRASEL